MSVVFSTSVGPAGSGSDPDLFKSVTSPCYSRKCEVGPDKRKEEPAVPFVTYTCRTRHLRGGRSPKQEFCGERGQRTKDVGWLFGEEPGLSCSDRFPRSVAARSAERSARRRYFDSLLHSHGLLLSLLRYAPEIQRRYERYAIHTIIPSNRMGREMPCGEFYIGDGELQHNGLPRYRYVDLALIFEPRHHLPGF